jgi:hypothetical protein
VGLGVVRVGLEARLDEGEGAFPVSGFDEGIDGGHGLRAHGERQEEDQTSQTFIVSEVRRIAEILHPRRGKGIKK